VAEEIVDYNIETEDEFEKQLNAYNDFIEAFIENFQTDLYASGIINHITPEDLQKYFRNPDKNVEMLSKVTEYFYISTGEVHMLFELLESLPTLKYKIESWDQPDNHEKHIAMINKTLHKVKHKRLTRDVLKQTAADGTLVGIWLGNKNNIYPYIFDSPKYAFPAYRKNGEWVVHFDLEYIDKRFKEFGKKVFFENLSPYITEQHYQRYMKTRSEEDQYVELPQNRTFVVNTHTLKRNQGLGTGWANSALFDILHKRKLKNVEQSIANKIINAIAILTIGSEKNEKYANLALGKSVKRKVLAGVKKALEKSKDGNVPVVGIPEFAKLEFPDVKADGLDGKKFDHVNLDIQTGIGVSSAMINGTSGNSATSRLNLDVLYKRIGVLLENIETDMYQKMINLILPKGQKDNYYLVYDKQQPLTTKEKVDILSKLNDKGWSVKALVDNISDINWENYLEQTLYETEELKLQSRLIPYKSTHTISSNDGAGAPEKPDDELSDEGEKTRTGDKNNI